MLARLLLVLALALAAPAAALAQSHERAPPLIPGQTYDTAIPAPEQVLGYALGQRLSRSADVLTYFEALAEAAPDRMVLGRYGQTWEGRPLPYAVISSARNIARLEQIRAGSLALADPRLGAAALPDQPVIVWLAYSVHGNEISPAEAAMATARHLLASRDAEVAQWLDQAVVVMVPTQNPDGRDRFMQAYYAGLGLEPDPDASSVERDEPWPSGRFNHYLFDLNRDWLALTQPETRGHVALMLQWRPQVVVDAHEMGTDDTFFFPPEAEPLNPLLPEAQLRARHLFGRATAGVFDRYGVEYFTREVFDAFYPGYGDGFPSYLGAVGMTYEQGSARGLVARRSSGEILTYWTTVRNHFLASLSTIRTAAANRAQLLSDFGALHRQAMAEGGSAAWIFSRGSTDPGSADALASLLTRQGVEVSRASAAFSACGRSYQAGDYIIRLGQPLGRMARVLLDPSITMRPEFVELQEQRRARGEYAEVYDVTAWSLPVMFNVDAAQCRNAPGVAAEPVTPDERPGMVTGDPQSVAWIVPAGSQGMEVLTRGLRAGLRIRSAEAGFTVGGRSFPEGSLIIQRAGQPEALPAILAGLAAQSGAEIIGVPDSWVTEGPSFASDRSPDIPPVRIALAWDDPTDPSAAGAVRYVLEQRYGYPVSIVRTSQLASGDLSRYHVIILPDGGNYAEPFGEAEALRRWVQQGGVLIGLGGATDFLIAGDNAFLPTTRESLATEGDAPEDGAQAIADADDYAGAITPTEAQPDYVLGVLAQVELEPDHWLSTGLPSRLNVLVNGSAIYSPLRRDEGVNVARFPAASDLLVAGHLWEENRRQLAFKPYVMVRPMGQGRVIGFTQDPTFRGYLRGLDVLFLNAIFRGAAQ